MPFTYSVIITYICIILWGVNPSNPAWAAGAIAMALLAIEAVVEKAADKIIKAIEKSKSQ
jgi:hypothetical protein